MALAASTYKEFGDRVGCDYTTVSRLLSGERSPSTRLLYKICDEFELDANEALQALGTDQGRPDGRTPTFAEFLRTRTIAAPDEEPQTAHRE